MLGDNTGLLTFDDDSPLFVKKMAKSKREPRKKKVSAKIEDDIAQVETSKCKRKGKKKVVRIVNENIPKYTIKSPTDCKHILPAFKDKLNVIWGKLNGDNIVATDVANYIRGVANVAKKSRHKEYEELRILMHYAKQL